TWSISPFKHTAFSLIVAGLLSMQASLCAGKKSTQAQPGESHDAGYFPLQLSSSWRYLVKHRLGPKFTSTTTVQGRQTARDGSEEYLVETVSPLDTIRELYAKAKDGSITLLSREYLKSQSLSRNLHPPKLIMKAHPKPGDKWNWSSKSPLTGDIKEEVQVAGTEEVKVPAGTFKCLRLVTQRDMGTIVFLREEWYARSVGRVKTVNTAGPDTFISVLEKYSRANK
ncbi:MAG TPA: hypothetical protein V6D17_24390, partial [Candidatus Obscuribacterales bacterium]